MAFKWQEALSTSKTGKATNEYFIHEHILEKNRLGYVRNPRSLMEGTETLCRDDIGDLPGSPEHLWLRENANEIG